MGQIYIYFDKISMYFNNCACTGAGSAVAKAFFKFAETGRMKPSAFYDRVVDVMEELVKFTLLTRDVSPYLVDRYSERSESAQALSKRVNQRGL